MIGGEFVLFRFNDELHDESRQQNADTLLMTMISSVYLFLCLVALLFFHAVSNRGAKMVVLWSLSIVLVASQSASGEGGGVFGHSLMPLLPIFLFAFLGYSTLFIVRRSKVALYATIVFHVSLFLFLRHGRLPAILTGVESTYVTVGLAYIVFRVLQINIDYHNSTREAMPRPARYLYHLFAFYTFLSGPLMRFQNHVEQLDDLGCRELSKNDAYKGFSRTMNGIAKVVVFGKLLSDGASGSLYALMLTPPDLILPFAWHLALGLALFFLNIYVNFSGYMDIVAGIGGAFLLKIPENFNHPLESRNIFDFWQRWHITLSAWFKDYLFLPLMLHIERRGMKERVKVAAVALLYFLIFFLVGVWHGPNRTFLMVGVCLGGSAAGNFMWQSALRGSLTSKGYRTLQQVPAYRTLASGVTLSCIAGSLFFWWMPAENWSAFLVPDVVLPTLLGCAILWCLMTAAARVLAALIKVWALFESWNLERISHRGGTMYDGVLFFKVTALWFIFFFGQKEPPAFVYQYF